MQRLGFDEASYWSECLPPAMDFEGQALQNGKSHREKAISASGRNGQQVRQYPTAPATLAASFRPRPHALEPI